MKKYTTTVGDQDGFNFIKNPLQEGTHIFEGFNGIYVCQSPSGDFSRFKYMPARKAGKKEAAFYMADFNEQLDLCNYWKG
jgi:hypothetical protein